MIKIKTIPQQEQKENEAPTHQVQSELLTQNAVVNQQPRKIVETNAPTEASYQRFKTQQEHIYKIPDTYIGSVIKESREFFVFDIQNKKYIKATIEVPQGLERLFLEIISNASDNADRSRLCRHDPGKIEVKMDRQWVVVRNGGVPIPIQKKTDENIWVPQMIFGVLLSSSNYDPKRYRSAAGRNGYGAKLTNIFSKYFKVDIGDNIRKRRYVQIWENNMLTIHEPEITDYTGPNYVEISYLTDFQRFGYTEYTDEIFALYAGYATDFSWTCKVPVIFNGVDITAMNAKDYAKYYFNDDVNTIIHYEWPEEHLVRDKKGNENWSLVEFVEKKGVKVPKDPNIIPISELVIADTPDASEIISFANSMRTMLNGVHVNSAMKAFSEVALAKFNGSGTDKPIKLTAADVKKHFSVLLACRVLDPVYGSQSKEQLKSPTPKFSFNEKEIKPIENWKLMDRLYAQLEFKEMKNMAKTDGRKIRHVDVPKLQDANNAGTNKSTECILILCEGDSASSYCKNLIGLLEGGRDKYGVFPLKGKGLNVMRATLKMITENEEIVNLKKILGIRENVDYLDDTNFKTLRYGKIWIAGDADNDGVHFVGLIALAFHCRYQTLIEKKFIDRLRTPIVRVRKNRIKQKFLTQSSYETWKRLTVGNESWKHEYFKGLSTSTKDEIKEDSEDLRLVSLVYDEKSNEMINMAFQKSTEGRKNWLMTYNNVQEVEHLKEQSLTSFIENELILFELANLHRCLPAIDGLKEGQRKILWYCWLYWKLKSNEDKKMNVSALGGAVKTNTEYHYGNTSLEDTIVGMATQYVGTNNLSYLFPKGSFGSRDKHRDDCGSSRYIYTYVSKWVEYIFRKEDIPLLEIQIIDGSPAEPKIFLPVLPTILFNGTVGIGSGFSTFIPNYHPRDIANWYRCKLQGKRLPKILPFYNKFKGTIKIIDRKKKNTSQIKIKIKTPPGIVDIRRIEHNADNKVNNLIEPEENEAKAEVDIKTQLMIEDEEEQKARNEKLSMATYGVMNVRSDGVVVVSELPIQSWTHKYRLFLKALVETKEITDFKDYCNDSNETVEFHIYGMQNPTPEKLRLIKTFGLTNMTLLDINDRPKKYNSVLDILEEFYEFRLPYFEKLRLHTLNELTKDKNELDLKIKFISSVIEKKLIINERYEVEIRADMENLKIPYEIYETTKLNQLSKNKIVELQKKINELQKQINYYTQVTKETLWLDSINLFLNNLTEI